MTEAPLVLAVNAVQAQRLAPSAPDTRFGARAHGLAGWIAGLWGTFVWLWRSRVFLLVLAPLLMVASLLAGLDLAHRYGEIEGTRLPPILSLSRERSFGELYEYLLTGAAALTLARLWRRHRSPSYAVGAILFLWLLLDNSLELHERGGKLLAVPFGLPDRGAEPAHFGELFVFAGVGLLLAGAAVGAARAEWPRPNLSALLVIVLAVGAGFFGVAIDALIAIVRPDSVIAREAANFIEDGGELAMLVLASAVALALGLLDRRGVPMPAARCPR